MRWLAVKGMCRLNRAVWREVAFRTKGLVCFWVTWTKHLCTIEAWLQAFPLERCSQPLPPPHSPPRWPEVHSHPAKHSVMSLWWPVTQTHASESSCCFLRVGCGWNSVPGGDSASAVEGLQCWQFVIVETEIRFKLKAGPCPATSHRSGSGKSCVNTQDQPVFFFVFFGDVKCVSIYHWSATTWIQCDGYDVRKCWRGIMLIWFHLRHPITSASVYDMLVTSSLCVHVCAYLLIGATAVACACMYNWYLLQISHH